MRKGDFSGTIFQSIYRNPLQGYTNIRFTPMFSEAKSWEVRSQTMGSKIRPAAPMKADGSN